MKFALSVDRRPATLLSRGVIVSVSTDDGRFSWASWCCVDSVADLEGRDVSGADLEARGFRVAKG